MRAFRLFALVPSLALLAAATPDVPAPAPTDPQIAAAVASVSADRLRAIDEHLVAFGTRSTYSEGLKGPRGVVAAREWIAAQFRAIAAHSGGRMTVAYDSYLQPADPAQRVPRPVEITSVIATLHGDEPGGRTYVISSHYDSRNTNNEDGVHDAPGADDNGSGTACVLEAARALANVPMHATVIFATFDAEEQGLFGSGHFAHTLKAANVDVEGDLNNDIIGASVGPHGEQNPNDVRIFSEALPIDVKPPRINSQGGENDSPSRELARFAKETGDAYVTPMVGRLIFRADRFLRGGDHESFNAVGYPAIRFVEPVENFNHQHQDVRVENGTQYGDLMTFMDFDYLKHVTQYNLSTLAALALGPPSPKDAVIDVHQLANDTTLKWTAVPRAASYEVVRRATSDATWTSVTNVGSATTVTLPFSKDDWIFGVRAVDATGHRSVATFPAPKR
jgi:Zn-dependent M28 family amino/carboxypeptidase